MPRCRPTKRLGTYGHFDLKPEEAVTLNKQQLKSVFIKPPQWDVVRCGLDMFAVRTERKLMDLEAEQDRMKVEVKEQRKLNEFRIGETYKRHKDIHDQFIEVNAFVRDCADKERKTQDRIQEEIKKQEDSKANIEKLEEDLHKLLSFKDKMEGAVNGLKHFEETVETVVKESEHINSAKDFMDKCDALMTAQVEISEKEERKLAEIEEFRQRIISKTKEATTDFLGLNYILLDIEKAYETAKKESLKWEKVLQETRDVIVGQELQYNRIVDSTRQLYLLLCKRNGRDPALNRVNVEFQLDYVKSEIEIIREVLVEATELQAEEQKSILCEQGSEK